jgi:hypothetical protein
MHLSDNIAIAAAAISLVGAATAWLQARRASTLDIYSRTGDTYIQLNKVFIKNPELRPYFVEGEKKLPKGQEQKAKAVAIMMVNVLEQIWSQRGSMGKKERAAWEDYINKQVRSVELVNNAYKWKKDWYPNLKQILK